MNLRILFSVFFWLACTTVIGQKLTEAQYGYLHKEAHNLELDAAHKNGQWDGVSEAINDANIILLGEFTHGAGEVFTTRNDLIKYLHKTHGFDVILFEAGLGEVHSVQLKRDELSAIQMTQGFFGIWGTDEFVELMEFIKTEDIDMSGYDVQRSSRNFNTVLIEQAQALNIDSDYYDDLERRFAEVQGPLADRKSVYDSIAVPTQNVIRSYEALLDEFQKKASTTSEACEVVKQTLKNRIWYLNYMLNFSKTKDYNKRWAQRDLGMANNIKWLRNTFFKGRKVLIIGHNFHIARYNAKEEVMGEYLAKDFGTEMYVLGFFAGKGVHAGNYGNEKEILPPDAEQLDLKHIISTLPERGYFLNIPKVKTEENAWLFEDIVVNDTFIDLSSSNTMKLNKYFDGLVLLDAVSIPKKTLFKQE